MARVIVPKKTNLISSVLSESLSDFDPTTTYASGEKIYVLISDFAELITNGDCFFDSFETDGNEWSYDSTNTQYDCDASQVGVTKLYQEKTSSDIIDGEQYLIQFEVENYVAGNVAGYCGGAKSSNISADGVYQQLIDAGSSNNYIGVEGDASFNGSITNVLVKKTGDNVQRDIYESQQSQAGNFPPWDVDNSYANWVRLEASNRWKMFDDYTSTQSEFPAASGALQVKVEAAKCDSYALFNVEGTNIQVIAVENSANYKGTSSTSLSIGQGSTGTISTDAGKSWSAGDLIEIEYDTNKTQWMVGEITSYNSDTGALVVDVTSARGGGTYSTWTIRYVYSDTTSSLYLAEVNSWSDYFFAEIRFAESKTDTFTISYDLQVRFVITGNSGQTIRCGHCLVGQRRYLGKSQYGVSAGINDYSTKETNTFGETYLEQGSYSKTNELDIWIEKSSTDQIFTILSKLRSTPCAWDFNEGDTDYSTLVLYGFYQDYDILMQDYAQTLISIEIQGLTQEIIMGEITQTITDPGTAPQRTDPDNFDSRADAFLSAIESWDTELSTYASQANSLRSDVNGYKSDAETA